MTSLLKEITEMAKEERAVNEKYEDMSQQELYDEVLRQYKNLEVFKASIEENPRELHRVGGGIIGSARDLAQAVNRFMKQR